MKIAQESTAVNKKIYTKPSLILKGNIAKLTLSCTDKNYGASDGITFQGQDITFNCS